MIRRSLPALSPTPHSVFATHTRELVPRVAIAELPHGRVMAPHSAVVSGDGALVHEVSAYFGTAHPREHPLYLHPFPAPARHIEGRLGVLALRGDANYYHFLIDVLPRLAVAAACTAIEQPDRWYVPARTTFQRGLLSLVGLTDDRIIDSTLYPHVIADTLVVPGPPAMTVRNPPWIVPFLRGRLMRGPVDRIPGRGIYVTRGRQRNNRCVANEERVSEALSLRGFGMIDPGRMTVEEQIRVFAEASVIVAPHGAALANLVFASPGATVVELFPAGYAVPDYWKLADGVPGLGYRYLLGAGPVRVRSLSRFLVEDIVVDVRMLESLLDDVMAQDSAA
jgi:capsular polysaccharide biosynthesis protein